MEQEIAGGCPESISPLRKVAHFESNSSYEPSHENAILPEAPQHAGFQTTNFPFLHAVHSMGNGLVLGSALPHLRLKQASSERPTYVARTREPLVGRSVGRSVGPSISQPASFHASNLRRYGITVEYLETLGQGIKRRSGIWLESSQSSCSFSAMPSNPRDLSLIIKYKSPSRVEY
jgi:hypothetical protein